MLIKLDHKVSWALGEDRHDVVDQLKRSYRSYAWAEGEIIAHTIENFAIANPRATFGDLMEWSKKTYLERVKAQKMGAQFGAFKMQGDYNPTKGATDSQEFSKHGVSTIADYQPARPKVRQDLKKVADPGEEGKVDADDLAALGAENPDLPPIGTLDQPEVEMDYRSEGEPDKEPSPLAQRGLLKK